MRSNGGWSSRGKVVLINAAAIGVMFVLLLVLDGTVDRVQINGSLCQDIDCGKNLVSAVLPSPLSVVEVQLATYEILGAARPLDSSIFRAAQAHLQSLNS